MFPSTQVAALDTPILPSCPLHILGHHSIYFSWVCPPLPAAFASVQPSSSCPWGLPTAAKLCPMLTSHCSQGIFLEQCLFKSRNVTISITQVPQSPIARPFLVFFRCHSFPHCFPHLLMWPQPLLHLSPKYDTPSSDLEGFWKQKPPHKASSLTVTAIANASSFLNTPYVHSPCSVFPGRMWRPKNVGPFYLDQRSESWNLLLFLRGYYLFLP